MFCNFIYYYELLTHSFHIQVDPLHKYAPGELLVVEGVEAARRVADFGAEERRELDALFEGDEVAKRELDLALDILL